ncbi:MAG: biotin--[acetyl-CoA-carboxylase] ligase [Thermofilum sp.]
MESVKRKLLEQLAVSTGHIPAEKLAEDLGVPRAVVERLAEELRGEGYPVESSPELGYRLAVGDNLEEAGRYAGALDTSMAFSVHFLEACTSTQDVAAALARRGAPEGTLVVAEEQTRGRGRLGRAWTSLRGGLWFTLVLRPPELSAAHLLSLALGVAVARAVRAYGVDARLKWPNDVLAEGRKLAGILVEGESGGGAHFLLAGIGVNVNNELPPELSTSATSLRELLGRPVPRVPLLLRILREVDRIYSKLREEPGGVLSEWKKLSSTLGRRVRVITLNGVHEGLAVDVDDNGGLVVEVEGRRATFYAGDVVHLR